MKKKKLFLLLGCCCILSGCAADLTFKEKCTAVYKWFTALHKDNEYIFTLRNVKDKKVLREIIFDFCSTNDFEFIIEKEEHFVSGSSTRILGRQLTIQVHQARRKQIIREDSVLHIYTPETDQLAIDRQVNNWWQKSSKEYFQDILNRLYPIVEKHGVAHPDICIKKMRGAL